MKRAIAFFGIIVMLGTLPAAAQITITRALPDSWIGKSFIQTDYNVFAPVGINAIVTTKGENQTWDLSGIIPEDTSAQMLDILGSPVGTPGEELFPSSNMVWELSEIGVPDTSFFQYLLIENDAISILGSAAVEDVDEDMVDDTLAIVFDPPQVGLPFPLTFGTTFRDSSAFHITAGGFTFTTVEIIEAEADGWGTLILPYGSFEVIRISTMSIVRDPFFPADTTWTVDFVGSSGPLAEADYDPSTGEVTEVDYSMMEDNGSVAIEESELPASISLGANYPNPFNPATVIPLTVSKTTAVQVDVYDLTGKLVEALSDRVMAPGTYDISWDAASRPSGTYFVRVRADGQLITRAVTLLR